MSAKVPIEIISSKTTLAIADLLSRRPRTLSELADRTGISIQAVLKHLEKLDDLGILEERKVTGKSISVRKLYALKGVRVGDFSTEEITVVKMTKGAPESYGGKDPVGDLERTAEDALVQKRRIREQARRLGRSIAELVGYEERMTSIIESLGLGDEERLIVQTMFSEETMEDAEKELRRVHGIENPRRSIERTLTKVMRSVKK